MEITGLADKTIPTARTSGSLFDDAYTHSNTPVREMIRW